MPKNEWNDHLNKCLQTIEDKLGWGKSDTWTNYDFEKLSDEVHNRTDVRLSVTTLKRIWGKVKYENAPTLTTLNTLAQFAGYIDWRNFCQYDIKQNYIPVGVPTQIPTPIHKKTSRYWFALIIPLVAVIFLLARSNTNYYPDPDDFSFKADKMKTEGVPNSVVFHYDASAAQTDSVFIVQTWDIRRKKLVPKDRHEHSAIYYYPGFFNTRLIADGEVVKHHELWITSDGWLCLTEKEPIPLYFKKEETIKEGVIEVDEATLKKYNLALHPDPPRIRFFNQRDLGDIMSDNFTFETTLKNPFQEGTGACQYVQILIQCKDDVIIIPLGAQTCVGDMYLYFCGSGVQSQGADLSGFGCDLNQWTTLRIESVDKHVNLFVNGKKAYALTFPNNATGVVGVQYRFNGMGAVKDTWFESKGVVTKL